MVVNLFDCERGHILSKSAPFAILECDGSLVTVKRNRKKKTLEDWGDKRYVPIDTHFRCDRESLLFLLPS